MDDEKPNKVGRPTKYEPRFCQIMEEELAKGHSIEASSSILKDKDGNTITSRTVFNWMDDHEEFFHAIKSGVEKGLHYLESIGFAKMTGRELKSPDGKKMISAKKFDTTMIIFALKTRHHKVWGDKKNQEEEDKPISITYNVLPAPSTDE